MEKFLTVIKIILKIIISFILCLPFIIFEIATFQVFFDELSVILRSIVLCIIIWNVIMLYYINWAIWTKGKIKKLVMFFVILLVVGSVLSIGPN